MAGLANEIEGAGVYNLATVLEELFPFCMRCSILRAFS